MLATVVLLTDRMPSFLISPSARAYPTHSRRRSSGPARVSTTQPAAGRTHTGRPWRGRPHHRVRSPPAPNPLVAAARLTYDALGNATSLADPVGNTTAWVSDA